MITSPVTAVAYANIAFIKYWGNRDDQLRLPSSGSISMNLDGLFARTSVHFDEWKTEDSLTINGKVVTGTALSRVCSFLDLVRHKAQKSWHASVTSENNFPLRAGIASSAAAFAALSLAAARAIGLELTERELSRLARLGSGSACRSIPGGFVEWEAGRDDQDSYAHSIAPPDHWGLVDHIAIVSDQPKKVGSSDGHLLANTSPFQAVRVNQADHRLSICRQAILKRNFDALAEISELDSNMLHAVTMTGQERLLYWKPGTITIMQAVESWRKSNLPVFYTLDAGPNVHVICSSEVSDTILGRLTRLPGVLRTITARPGGPAYYVQP
jgi:diphosphomevalonate decarboxylase